MQDALAYDGYGNITSQTPNPPTVPLYSYTGRELDTQTDLQYNRARWYNPATGRWMTQDPLGFAAGDSNLYRYVRNQPQNTDDSSGLLGVAINAGATALQQQGKNPNNVMLSINARRGTTTTIAASDITWENGPVTDATTVGIGFTVTASTKKFADLVVVQWIFLLTRFQHANGQWEYTGAVPGFNHRNLTPAQYNTFKSQFDHHQITPILDDDMNTVILNPSKGLGNIDLLPNTGTTRYWDGPGFWKLDRSPGLPANKFKGKFAEVSVGILVQAIDTDAKKTFQQSFWADLIAQSDGTTWEERWYFFGRNPKIARPAPKTGKP